MSAGDSSIAPKAATSESQGLSFADILSPVPSSFQLTAQPVFDGSSILNGNTAAAPPASPAQRGFDGRAVLGIGAAPGRVVYDGKTPPSAAPFNGNHVFFQARPDWRGPQPTPVEPPHTPGYTGAQPGYAGGPVDPRLRQSIPAPDAPTFPRPAYPTATIGDSHPWLTGAQNAGAKTVEWGIIGGAGVLAYAGKEKYFPAPKLVDAIATEASAQALAEPLKNYNMANVNYQEALEAHFKPVTSFLSKTTSERAAQIESHAVLLSSDPKLEQDRRALMSMSTASDRDSWKKAFEDAAKGRTNFEAQARDYFVESRRLTNWMNRVPEIGRLKDTPPLPDESIVNAMTGQNKLWAEEYKAETTKLGNTMADRLLIQGQELVEHHKWGNGVGWMLGAAAYDYWYDSNYYRDARPGGYTYGADIAQMAITMLPVTRKIGFALKIGGIVLTHLFGRALDAQNQGKA